ERHPLSLHGGERRQVVPPGARLRAPGTNRRGLQRAADRDALGALPAHHSVGTRARGGRLPGADPGHRSGLVHAARVTPPRRPWSQQTVTGRLEGWAASGGISSRAGSKEMDGIKTLIKKTPLYPVYTRLRQERAVQQWDRAGRVTPPPHLAKQQIIREYA